MTTTTDLAFLIDELKICVLLPTYNNAGSIVNVVESVMIYCPNVIVINDGSTDNTLEQLKPFQERITLFSYTRNKGKGYALKCGFRIAVEMGYRHVITIDSDGQHFADDLMKFIVKIAETPNTLLVGERNLNDVQIKSQSSFANKFSNFWFSLYTAKRLNDTQTGYRAYPVTKLKWMNLVTNRYESELELLIFSRWHGIKITGIPIKVYYPPIDKRVSHFRPGIDFLRISLLNTLLFPLAFLFGYPMMLWYAVKNRILFKNEFKLFTRHGDKQREAAVTVGRLFRSVYGLLFFIFYSVFIFTPFALIYFNIGKKTVKKKRLFHKMLKCISQYITIRFPGSKVKIENPYKETFAKPAMVICNHQSHLDLPMILSVSEKFICLTNDRVWKNKIYGVIIRYADFAPVSTDKPKLLAKLHEAVNNGYSIMVFPEGTRSEDCSILRFHQGAFYLARELGIDIVPMVLHGAGHYLPKRDFMFRKGSITLRILKRVQAEEFTPDILLRKEASFFRNIIRDNYIHIAQRREKTAYFKSLVFYKYAYRGWAITSEAKKILRAIPIYAEILDSVPGNIQRVKFINSGIGIIPLLYALVNKNVEIIAYESDFPKYVIAQNTPCLPSNLKYYSIFDINSGVTENDFDMTYIISYSQYPETLIDNSKTTVITIHK